MRGLVIDTRRKMRLKLIMRLVRRSARRWKSNGYFPSSPIKN